MNNKSKIMSVAAGWTGWRFLCKGTATSGDALFYSFIKTFTQWKKKLQFVTVK